MASKSQKGKFLNQIPTLMNPEGTSMWSALGKMIKGTPDRRPPHPIDTSALSLEEFATHKYANENFYIWLGHSSIYLQIDGLRIFIDPVFSPSTSPVSFLGPKAFAFTNKYSTASFPDPDIVIITHDHYDHLDKQAIKDFAEKTKEFIVPLRVGSILQKWGVPSEKILEMDWDDTFNYNDNFKITAQSGRHFSGRGISNRNSTLWCSYVLESSNTKIFLSGDSGYGPHFKQIGEDHGPFKLAFIECGQYNENWPLIHMMPEETVVAAKDLKTQAFIPIHWGKFALSLHAWDEPPKRAKLEAEKLKQNIVLPVIGEFNRFD